MANCLAACADLQLVDGNRNDAIQKVFTEVKSANQNAKDGNYLNNFYDDEGWWALAWIAVYDATKDNAYLQQAQSIFADMDQGWNSPCFGNGITGGMYWSKKPTGTDTTRYVNAITNELYISVAAHLANRAPDGAADYTAKATRGWTWLSGSGMMNSTGLFNDGLTQSCANNAQNGWTYNQGVILGALVELHQATADVSHLTSAVSIANAALSQFTANAGPVLRDACEPACTDENGQQFKGPFVRNLAALYAATRDTRYRDFVTAQADAIWAKDRDVQGMGPAANQLGLSWSSFVQAPKEGPNAVTHNSAMQALVAAVRVVSA